MGVFLQTQQAPERLCTDAVPGPGCQCAANGRRLPLAVMPFFSALFYLPVSDGSLTAVEVDAYLGYGQPAEGEA